MGGGGALVPGSALPQLEVVRPAGEAHRPVCVRDLMGTALTLRLSGAQNFSFGFQTDLGAWSFLRVAVTVLVRPTVRPSVCACVFIPGEKPCLSAGLRDSDLGQRRPGSSPALRRQAA